MKHVSIGIDIGSAAVTTAVLSADKEGRPMLAAVGRAASSGVRRGTVIDPRELSSSIRKSVSEASRLGNVKIRSVAVSFSGAGVSSALAHGVVAVARPDGEITGEDVKRVMQAAEALYPKNPNREVVHMIPRSYRVDNESGIADPVGMAGVRLEVEALFIDVQKLAMQNLVKAFDGAGVGIDEWLFGPLAAADAVLTKQQKEFGVMLLDIGSGTSDYVIFEEGRLVDAGVIPIGGERITHDIAVGLRTRVEVAEAVKVRYGHVLPDAVGKRDVVRLADFIEDETTVCPQRELAEIIQARLEDIFEWGEKTLRQAGRSLRLPAGVVLVGGSSLLPGIREFAKKRLRLPVERGVVQAVSLPDVLGTGVGLASAIGVALFQWREEGAGRISGRMFFDVGGSWGVIKRWLKIFLP